MSQNKVFETLNAMRGIAAISVVLFHMRGQLIDPVIAPGGYLAVDMFFVLSGFVIASAYDSRLADGLSLKRFALIRAVRFWPLLALGVGLGASRLLAAVPPAEFVIATTAGLFLIPIVVTSSGFLFAVNAPLWTLSFEMMVNLAYAAVYRFTTTTVLATCACVGAALMVATASAAGSNDIGVDIHTFPGGLGRTLYGFSMGVLVFRRGWRCALLPAWAIGCLLVACMFLPVSQSLRVFYDLTFAILLSPALVILGASVEPSRRFHRLAVYLGTISFGIYTIHAPLIGMAGRLSGKAHIEPTFVAVPLLAGLLIACPYIDRVYDIPLRRFLSDALGNRRGAAST